MLQYVAEAFAVIFANRVRSFLTALGLIIGVTAVIAIQVLGAGMAGAVGGILGSLNERSFYVFPSARQANFTRAAIRLAELKRARREVPNVVDAIPGGGTVVQANYGHKHPRVVVSAEGDARYSAAQPVYGRLFTTDDVQAARHLVMVSSDAMRKLGITGDVTGASLRIGERRYTIVALLAKPTQGIVPPLFNGDLYIPYTTYEADFARGKLIVGARFLVDDVSLLPQTETSALAWLSAIKKGGQYQSFDRQTLSKATAGVFGGITLVVALIGAVSLVVAGIGILNIMLVSVAERTREIGLRKAVGATRFQILLQFFTEALALSAIGCAIGLVLGLSIGGFVNGAFLVKLSGIVPPIPWARSVIIATGFATIVTLAFGTYPAWRAATLDPIEALRYE